MPPRLCPGFDEANLQDLAQEAASRGSAGPTKAIWEGPLKGDTDIGIDIYIYIYVDIDIDLDVSWGLRK